MDSCDQNDTSARCSAWQAPGIESKKYWEQVPVKPKKTWITDRAWDAIAFPHEARQAYFATKRAASRCSARFFLPFLSSVNCISSRTVHTERNVPTTTEGGRPFQTRNNDQTDVELWEPRRRLMRDANLWELWRRLVKRFEIMVETARSHGLRVNDAGKREADAMISFMRSGPVEARRWLASHRREAKHAPVYGGLVGGGCPQACGSQADPQKAQFNEARTKRQASRTATSALKRVLPQLRAPEMDMGRQKLKITDRATAH